MKTVSTHTLTQWLAATLNVAAFSDYCPNGLQVEGKHSVGHIVTGVTASQALVDVAAKQRADALLVHHGWFWKGEDPRLVGTRKARVASLLAHDLNLLAYHLLVYPNYQLMSPWCQEGETLLFYLLLDLSL